MSESDSDSVPELVDSSDEESTEDTQVGNVIYANVWLERSKKFLEKQEHNIHIFSLGPFLFGVNKFVPQSWICALSESGLLLNEKRANEITVFEWEEWAMVDLVEQVVLVMLKKLRKKAYLVNCLDFVKEIETHQKDKEKIDVDLAISEAEKFERVKKIWTRSMKTFPCKQKERETKFAVLYVAKLYHILVLGVARDSKDVAEEMRKTLKQTRVTAQNYKDAGNEQYQKAKYETATEYYTKAAKEDPLYHIYFGNRSQSYCKLKKFEQALADGRRAITLKPDWSKGHYRYAHAFAELNKLDLAVAVNKRGLQICENGHHKNNDSNLIELETQGRRLQKERDIRTQQERIKRVLEDKNYADQFLEEETPAELRNLPGRKRVIRLTDALSGCDISPPATTAEIPDNDISDASSDEEMSPKIEKAIDPPKKKVQITVNDQIRNTHSQKETSAPAKVQQNKKMDKLIDENKNNSAQQMIIETTAVKQSKKSDEMKQLLSEGSRALANKQGRDAVTSYSRALELTAKFDCQTLDIEEADLVVLKYAYGSAAISTGVFKYITDGILKFIEITKLHQDFKFPLAYYGLGKAFISLNRFPDAQQPLTKGLSMVEKSGNNMIMWPGSDKKIEESNTSLLRTLFKELLRVSKFPPKPDAVCRYHSDEEEDSRTVIYFSDPDFKGFVRILCRAKCCIEFHNNCWRIFKARFDKTIDKDILDKPCPTPDCDFTITKISIFRQDALQKEMESEKIEVKSVSKKKPAMKTAASSEYKIQRKLDRKLVRQQKRKEAQEQNKDLMEDINQMIETGVSSTSEENNPEMLCASAGGNNSQRDDSDTEGAPLDHTKPVAVLRRDEEEKKLNKYKGTKKQKQKKKKEKTVKQVINVEVNFTGEREKYLQNEFDAPDEVEAAEKMRNKYGEPNFTVPPDLQDRVQAFERTYKPIEQIQFDDITSNLFSFFGDLLEAHGPLHVEDTRITSMVEDFPEDAKAKIEECGGLSKFLQQSLKFAMIDDILCLLKDAVKARDISKARNTAWQTLKSSERDSMKLNTAVSAQVPPKNPWKTVSKNQQHSDKNSVYTDKFEFPSLLNSAANDTEFTNSVVQSEKHSYDMETWSEFKSNKPSTVDSLDDFDDIVTKKSAISALDDDFDYPPMKGGSKMDCIDMIDDIPIPTKSKKKTKKVKHIDDLDSIDSYSGSESESNQEGSIISDKDSLSSEFSNSRSGHGKDKYQFSKKYVGDGKMLDFKPDSVTVSRSSSRSDLSEKSGSELSSDLVAKSFKQMDLHRSPLTSPGPPVLTKESIVSSGSKFGPIGSPVTAEGTRNVAEKDYAGYAPQPLKIPSFIRNKPAPSSLQEEAEQAAAQEIYRTDSQLVNEIANKVMDQIYSGQNVPDYERLETFNRVKNDIWNDFNRDKQANVFRNSSNSSSPVNMPTGLAPSGYQRNKEDYTENFMKKHYQQNITDPLGQKNGLAGSGVNFPLSTGFSHNQKTNLSSDPNFPSFHSQGDGFPSPLSLPRTAVAPPVKFPDVIAVTSSIWTANTDNVTQNPHSFSMPYFSQPPLASQTPKSNPFGNLSIGTSLVQTGSDKSFLSPSLSNSSRIYEEISLSKVNQCVQASVETMCVETMTDPYEPYKHEYLKMKDIEIHLKSDLGAATKQIEELVNLLQQSDQHRKETEMKLTLQQQVLEQEQQAKACMEEEVSLYNQKFESLAQELQKREAMELELRHSLNAAEQKCLELQKQQNEERQLNLHLQAEKTDAVKNKEEFRKIMEYESLRAQNSEIEELNTRQKYSIQMLEKSQKESFCYQQHLAGVIKKMEEDNIQIPVQLQQTAEKYKFIAQKCEETVKRLKTEFEEQIQQIREGKKLADLKEIFIPPPPPPPPMVPQFLKDLQPQPQGGNSGQSNKVHPQGGMPSLADIAMSASSHPSMSNAVTSQMMSSGAGSPAQPKPLGLPPGMQKPKPLIPPTGLTGMQSRPLTGANLHVMMNPNMAGSRLQTQTKNSFEKLVQKLSLQFPNYDRAVFTHLIQEVRASRGGSLSGMTLDEIVQYVRDTIGKYESSGCPVPGASVKEEKSAPYYSQASALSDFGTPLKRPVGAPPVGSTGGWHFPAPSSSSAHVSDFGTSQNEVFEEEEDPCVICHEEMRSSVTVRLECKHVFHDECVRKWLREQSTCPTCRKYALLPDEFPSLK